MTISRWRAIILCGGAACFALYALLPAPSWQRLPTYAGFWWSVVVLPFLFSMAIAYVGIRRAPTTRPAEPTTLGDVISWLRYPLHGFRTLGAALVFWGGVHMLVTAVRAGYVATHICVMTAIGLGAYVAAAWHARGSESDPTP